MITALILIIGILVALIFKNREPDISLTSIVLCITFAVVVAIVEIPVIAILYLIKGI